MGKVIPDTNGGGSFPPSAYLRETGAMLKGILTNRREVKTKFGMRSVFVFKVMDATCKFMQDGHEVQPGEGDLVDVMAPTRLARQLAQVETGSTVTMSYKGTKKVGVGNPAHIFDVVVD